VHAHVHARGRRVMLVDHEPVEARLIGELVLVQIALVVRRGDGGVEEAIGKLEAERGVLEAFLVRKLVMRHLAEVVELHGYAAFPRKSITRRATASGCSMGGMWPQPSSTDSVAFGRSRRYCSPHSTGTMRSSRPHTMSAGLYTRGRQCASRGLCL